MNILKSNWLLGSLIALSLSGTYATVGLADDFGLMGRKGLFKELNLTADQKEKLKKLREDGKGDRKEAREEMKKQGKAFREKMGTQASDDELRKEFTALQGKRAELAKSHFEHMLKVRAIFTPEQRKKFAEVMENKMKHHKGKFGKRPHHGADGDDEKDEE